MAPSETNGLRKRSQIMIDKASTTQRDKIGSTFGHLDDETMMSVTRSLAVFLGIA
ncbi:type II toxin-antitoxin system PemK/MazF family toxin [Acidiphilium sp.]|uniref:type II toxin-antitoxin system PemK/MazF family toxin n=1 Tax=Acidiphilium sp. TaxID=527 RepID=UPI002D1FA4B7|nr:type II toxin-antitoxin system PemK/MazF family toxin [Acidiphilium sp.]